MKPRFAYRSKVPVRFDDKIVGQARVYGNGHVDIKLDKTDLAIGLHEILSTNLIDHISIDGVKK